MPPIGEGDGAPDRESSPDRNGLPPGRGGVRFASWRICSSEMGAEGGRSGYAGLSKPAPVLLLRAKPWPHPSFLRFGAGDSGSPAASPGTGAETCRANRAAGPAPAPANGSIVGVGAAETLFRMSREDVRA